MLSYVSTALLLVLSPNVSECTDRGSTGSEGTGQTVFSVGMKVLLVSG